MNDEMETTVWAVRPSAWMAMLTLLATACGGTQLEDRNLGRATRPVVDGTVTDQYQGVVHVVTPIDATFVALCSGTLITPRVVVTAAHCLENASIAQGRVWFGQQPDRHSTDNSIRIIYARRHPNYGSGEGDGIFINDIALLLLESDAPTEAVPYPILASDKASSLPGMNAEVVGYGITQGGGDDAGTKRVGIVKITAITSQSIKIQPDPGNTCQGDSGGPLFVTIDGTRYLTGVISNGAQGCQGQSEMFRVDAFRDDLVQPFVDEVAAGSRVLAARCYYDGNCQTGGTCVASIALANVKYCSKECAADAECSGGTYCLTGGDGKKMCHFPVTLPSVMGGFCAANDSCETGLCTRARAGAIKLCAAPCNPSQTPACPSTFQCAPDLSNPGQSACFPLSATPPTGGGGGCASAGGGLPGAWILLGALLLAGALLRRRDTLSTK